VEGGGGWGRTKTKAFAQSRPAGGLKSRAYGAGRLSRSTESGEYLFNRLLAQDLNPPRQLAGQPSRASD